MARKARGKEWLDRAQECLSKAKTAEALRQAQAVAFPLLYGMSIKQTAQAIGVSPGWASQLRNRFLRDGGHSGEEKSSRGGRHRQNMSPEQEEEFLAPFLGKAKTGGILVVSEIKQAMDQRLNRKVPLSSAYNLLHRHGWRKLAPDQRHPKSDVAVQEEWKKNSPTSLPKSAKRGRGKRPSD
jgi:transposase